jgi:hypothetical protein
MNPEAARRYERTFEMNAEDRRSRRAAFARLGLRFHCSDNCRMGTLDSIQWSGYQRCQK